MADVVLILRDTTAGEDLVTNTIDSTETAMIAARTACLRSQAELNLAGLGSPGRTGHAHQVKRDGVAIFSINPMPAWVAKTLRFHAPGGSVLDEELCETREEYAAVKTRFQLGVELNPTHYITEV